MTAKRQSFERTLNNANPPTLEGNVKPLISSGYLTVASSRPYYAGKT
ncbi:hypothetical protein PYCH_13650 [Pyrococcus yayanosii CH1]|uniref:Uncharacterized protein n=1 Tax=Pyrococcus yayanosii (strain CH1 / JCM 16557) TaxID=529709 RepID=F8AJF4_PYRYC|nr:hypothetical protein PYCH_13650 [Pyrococcus yayanosii CH1]